MRSKRVRGLPPSWLPLIAALAMGVAFAEEAAPEQLVVFELNDALVKDKRLPNVVIAVSRDGVPEKVLGSTGENGRLEAPLEAGSWLVSYRLPGYVPIEKTELTVTGPALVTATLSPMLEAMGASDKRRVQLVLNWGSDSSQAKDLDSHLRCGCPQSTEVYFSSKEHHGGDHTVELDVDDMDWGGPETITLLDAPPGEYEYWVERYSWAPPHLGGSGAIIRVIFDDRVEAEYRVPPELDRKKWRPFKRLVVDEMRQPRIVPFTEQELAQGADRSSLEEDDKSGSGFTELACCCGGPAFLFIGVIGLVVAIKRASR